MMMKFKKIYCSSKKNRTFANRQHLQNATPTLHKPLVFNTKSKKIVVYDIV